MGDNNTKAKAEYLSGGVFNCLYDEYFTLIYAQNKLYDFLGYTPEEMEQLFHNHLLECIYSDDRKALKEEISRQLAHGNVFMYENRLTTKSGDIRWVWMSAELRFDEQQHSYFHCIFHDITNTKKNQEKLAISEQRYEIVLAQMQDIIFELDCRTFDIYYSPNFEKKFGYQIPVKGFPDSMFATDIIYEADKAELRRKFRSMLEGGERIYHEYRIKHKDGHYIWVDVHATVMRDADGNLLKILGIISDIHKRKTEILETRKMANLDPLTGLLNRRECVRRMNRYMEDSNDLAALLIIDVDNFKTLNDTMGHLYGDAVLSGIAEGLLVIFRRDDIVARIGGDEFVIFMPGLRARDNVIPKLEDIQRLFNRFKDSGKSHTISCSIGVSYYPEHGTDFTALFSKADTAMYHAKKHGKGQYCIYEEGELPAHIVSQKKPLTSMKKNFHDHIIEYIIRITLENPDDHSAVPAIMNFIGRTLRADRIFICRKIGDAPTVPVYHWCSSSASAMEETLQEIDTLDWNVSSDTRMAAFPDTAQIPDSQIRSWFERRGAQAAFLCWMENSGNLTNLIGFEDCHKTREEIEEVRYTICMVCEILNLFLVKER